MSMPLAVVGQSTDLSEYAMADSHSEQAYLYAFTQYSSAYQDVTNPDFQINALWDDTIIPVPDYFNQDYLGVSMDTMYTELGASLLGYKSTSPFAALIIPMNADLIDRGYNGTTPMSPISGVMTGTAPNRIYKMEWKNAGIFGEVAMNGTNNVALNIQLWLYENGTIEYHYGPSSISQAWNDSLYDAGELISGLAKINYISFELSDGHFLHGNPASAGMIDTINSLTAWPANGTVYKFSLPNVGQGELQTINVSLYPNPAVSELRINAEAGKVYDVHLLDMSGQVVKRDVLRVGQPMSLVGTPAGVYLVKLRETSSGATQVLRLIIAE